MSFVTALSNLPTSSTRIVGRDEIIESLARDVAEARLVSIVGAGGIGKTTVALAVAENAAELFEDGVWLVDFAPLKSGALVPHAIGAVTGLVVHSADVMPALCRSLRDRRILLVLDNCEHLAEAIAPVVEKILLAAPAVKILTTSRAPLRASGEEVRRLPGLGLPPDSAGLTAKEALSFPAIEMFVERATDRLESFSLHDSDAPAVADICRNLDGIALALELAAMRIDVFGVQGLQKQLDDRFRLLAGRRAGAERQRTMAATLDWSYGLLPSNEASVLRAVSVFAGVFGLDDAAATIALPPAEASKILGELAAQSLLSVDQDAGRDPRGLLYRPLATTRAYGLEKLVAAGEVAAIRTRHAERVCAVLNAAAAEVAQRPAREWGVVYGRYLDELRDALAWAAADPARSALLVRLTTAGTVLWNHFSLTEESCIHLERAIAALPATESSGGPAELNLQVALAGAVLFSRGMMPQAREAMSRAASPSPTRSPWAPARSSS